MKNLNRLDRRKPVTAKKLYGMIGEGERVVFYFAMDLGILLETVQGWSTQLDGLNDKVDELWKKFCPQVGGTLCDIEYEFCNKKTVGAGVFESGIQVTAYTIDLEWPEDVMTEARRRDEKNGLYPSKIDPAN